MGHAVRYPCRFYRWRSQGIWQGILNRLQQTADAANQIDARSTFYRQHYCPRTPTRRRRKKGEPNPDQQSLSVELLQQQEALGRWFTRL